MASDQLIGATILIVAKSPGGTEVPLFRGVNEQTGPAGSPDGIQAVVKDNELPFMPVQNFTLTGGDKILLKVIMKVADGADASDAVVNLPIIRNGKLEFLTTADLGYTADLPAASVADVEHQLGAGYTVPQGDVIQVGGGKYFMSIENDV